MATPAQIAANQANAQKSTGPRTPPGKATSCRNSLKHGLSGRGIVLPEAEEQAVAERLVEWRRSYAAPAPRGIRPPRDGPRVGPDRAVQPRGRRPPRRMVDRAADSWDDDRRIAAEELGRTLHRSPSLVSRKLQTTPQGCDWLIERWEALARAVESRREWTDEHRALASDLLGTDPVLRGGDSPLDGPAKDVSSGMSQSIPRFYAIQHEIARLRARREGVVSEQDADDRELARAGVEVEPDRPLGRLRRYAAACRRRFDAAAKVLRDAGKRVADRIERYRGDSREAAKVARARSEDVMLAKLLVGNRVTPPAPPSPVAPSPEPVEPARKLNRQQRRALARRRPELVPA